VVGDTQTQLAVRDFLGGLEAMGAEFLLTGDPQAFEDTCLRLNPDTCLEEAVLRQSWLALSDELSRTGHEPEFKGIGRLEHWVAYAVSRGYPFVDPNGISESIVSLAGQGLQVVILKGEGGDTILAQVRRTLLSVRPDVYVPAITRGAQETMGHLLRIGEQTPALAENLKEAVTRVQYGEDFIGILGRVGREQPVALLMTDAHLTSRSVLLGLPLFLEPDQNRDALLVLWAEEGQTSGPLDEIVGEARRRGRLTEITVPRPTSSSLSHLRQSTPGVPPGLALQDLEAYLSSDGASWSGMRDGLREIIAGQKNADMLHLEQRFQTLSEPVRTVLSVAALEGRRFHLAAVASVLDMELELAEDILLDEDFELDGNRLGGAGDFIESDSVQWVPAKEGVTPRLSFKCLHSVKVALAALTEDQRRQSAGALEAALWETFDVESLVFVAPTLWRLSQWTENQAAVLRACLGPSEPGRVEVAFKRLLPVLGLGTLYHLGLQRLYSAAMERGGLMNVMGRAAEADHSFQVAAATAQRLEQKASAGEALARLAELRVALALPGPAADALKVAGQLLSGESNRRSRSRLVLLEAEVAFLEGRYTDGCDILRAGSIELEGGEDWGHLCLCLSRLGRTLFALGEIHEAEEALDRSVRFADRSREIRAIGGSRLARAFVHSEQDELKDALLMLNQGAHAFSQASLPVYIFELAAAELQRRSGGAEEAASRFVAVGEQFEEMNAALQHADAIEGQARCQMDMGDFADASAALDGLLELRVRARDRLGLVRLYMAQWKAKAGCADSVGAFRFACMARALGERCGFTPVVSEMDDVITSLASEIDKVSDVSPESIGREAVSVINELEARWATQPNITGDDESKE